MFGDAGKRAERIGPAGKVVRLVGKLEDRFGVGPCNGCEFSMAVSELLAQIAEQIAMRLRIDLAPENLLGAGHRKRCHLLA